MIKYFPLEVLILYEEQKIFDETSPNKKKIEPKEKRHKKKIRYPRDESAYNASQENEFLFFLSALPFVVFYSVTKAGIKLKTSEFNKCFVYYMCLSIKDYFGMSLRRSISLIKFIFWAMKWKYKVPCFKTLNNYAMKQETSHIQRVMLEYSASPLKHIETHFNIDSTEESLITASTWFNWRIRRSIKKKDHLKEHVTSTAKYNVAVAVGISPAGDAKFIRPHVKKIIDQGFSIKHVAGDKGYLSRDGCNAVKEAGGQANFKIKYNTVSNAKSSQEWKRMVTAQKEENIDEINNYNVRQNAESTNSAKKKKFGSCIKSKLDITKETEAMGKWCVYNLTAICRAYYDNAADVMYISKNLHIERLLAYT
ncbi:MAG: hypothetical protein V1859_07530 [archaeon]